jgi:hypothetical protein
MVVHAHPKRISPSRWCKVGFPQARPADADKLAAIQSADDRARFQSAPEISKPAGQLKVFGANLGTTRWDLSHRQRRKQKRRLVKAALSSIPSHFIKYIVNFRSDCCVSLINLHSGERDVAVNGHT